MLPISNQYTFRSLNEVRETMYEQGKKDCHMTIVEAKKSRIEYKSKNMYSDETKCHEAHFGGTRTHQTSALSNAAQGSLPASSPSSTRYSHSSR